MCETCAELYPEVLQDTEETAANAPVAQDSQAGSIGSMCMKATCVRKSLNMCVYMQTGTPTMTREPVYVCVCVYICASILFVSMRELFRTVKQVEHTHTCMSVARSRDGREQSERAVSSKLLQLLVICVFPCGSTYRSTVIEES
jgi:hypothetical protein